MSSCALTDHGTLAGAIEFYRQCKEAEIKPILGCEAYLTYDPDGLEKEDMFADNMHLVLLAANNTGWRNLVWLISNAYLNNFYYKPRISWDRLEERNEGLIALSACLGGVIAKPCKVKGNEVVFEGGGYTTEVKRFEDPFGKCRERAQHLRDIFNGRFYAEIQYNDAMWEQAAFNNWVLMMAGEEGIPPIITCDAHYLTRQDHKVHALVEMSKRNSNKKAEEEQELTPKELFEKHLEESAARFGSDYYIKSPQEMWEIGEKLDVREAVENSIKIAEQCNVDITLGKYENPQFDITKCDDYQDFLKWKNEV